MRVVILSGVAALLLATAVGAQTPPDGDTVGEGPAPPGTQPAIAGEDAATNAKTMVGEEARPDAEVPPNLGEPGEQADSKENKIIPEPALRVDDPHMRGNARVGGGAPQTLDMTARELIGMKIHLVDVEDYGEVVDVVADPGGGNITGLVIETGGFLGLGGERVVIPWVGITLGEDEQSVHAPWSEAEVAAGDFAIQPGSPAVTTQR